MHLSTTKTQWKDRERLSPSLHSKGFEWIQRRKQIWSLSLVTIFSQHSRDKGAVLVVVWGKLERWPSAMVLTRCRAMAHVHPETYLDLSSKRTLCMVSHLAPSLCNDGLYTGRVRDVIPFTYTRQCKTLPLKSRYDSG